MLDASSAIFAEGAEKKKMVKAPSNECVAWSFSHQKTPDTGKKTGAYAVGSDAGTRRCTVGDRCLKLNVLVGF